MDYSEIKQIALQKGIANDPCWADANFLISPIPEELDALGLYFPMAEYIKEFDGIVPSKTIVLPPDAKPVVLLHELGHRHGDYYHHDLSEEYAQAYAHQHQGLSMVLSSCMQRGLSHCCYHKAISTTEE